MCLLVVRELSVPSREAGGHPPLPGPIQLTLRGGESLAVHGPSAAGKTTLLRALARLEPSASGELLFAGRPIRRHAVPHYRRTVQYLPQTAVRLPGTVEDNLCAAFTYAAAGTARFDRDQAMTLCQQLGLDGSIMGRPAHALSGGEAQRLALLRALVLQPQVLLLDEPTASLDPSSQQRVEAAIAHWRQQHPRRALVLVSHDPQQRARMTERTLHLLGGRMADPGERP